MLPRERTQLLPALLLAQEEFGYVSDDAALKIASHIRLTANDVEGVVTAYPDLRRAPAGERTMRVCTGPACLAAGGERLLAELAARLDVAPGETSTNDVTLDETACCFCCAMAPVVEVNGRRFGRLSVDQAETLIDDPAPHRTGVQLSATTSKSAEARFLVSAGSCGLAVGADAIAAALRREVESRAANIEVIEAGCAGMDSGAVQVTLQQPGANDLAWNNVQPRQARSLVAIAAGNESANGTTASFAWDSDLDLPTFFKRQTRVLLEHVGRVHPTDIDEAMKRGRYAAFEQTLQDSSADVVAEVERSGLAGRGGAYFPVATKWKACLSSPPPRYLVVNAEEGEPGVFKDRHLLEGDPHLAIEGMLIAAFAIDASNIVVYLNGHAPVATERLAVALEQARGRGLIGSEIRGSAFSCEVELRAGGGGYVLGEESVILESVEGSRPMPRVRPPFPVTVGLHGQPTVINNVESLANVPLIVSRGAAWFRGMGSEQFPGTKLICISGDIALPGLVEVEIGTPLRMVIEEICGGVPGERTVGAVLTGGPSGMMAPPSMLDIPLTPRQPDVLLGSGNITVFDDSRSLLELVRRLARFNAEESCGKCTPCREGVARMHEIIERIGAGEGRPRDRQDLVDLCEIAASASLCGHGQMAPNPVRSALERFTILGV